MRKKGGIMKRKSETVANDVVFLQGKRIYLRPPTKEDIPYFLRWMNDQEVIQYLATFLPKTEADEVAWLEHLHRDKETNVVFVVLDTKSRKPIGIMGIHGINWKSRLATTGAVIGEKEYWGRGYGSEAKMLLLNFAFNTLNLRKICSLVFGFNERSIAYSKKCGYEVEGILKAHHFKNGAYCDEVHMAVFKEQWQPIWEQFEKSGRI
jgi:RimJ/RimL family protein N-acetyltransferase